MISPSKALSLFILMSKTHIIKVAWNFWQKYKLAFLKRQYSVYKAPESFIFGKISICSKVYSDRINFCDIWIRVLFLKCYFSGFAYTAFERSNKRGAA